jgi:dTDP-4-amino-4,6-dideoxygalactose transaminase
MNSKLTESRPNPIPFALPEIGEEEVQEVTDTLRSGWLTTGPKTQRFEKEFAAFVGAPHALAVNSATAGLHLALEAVGVGPGDTVLTTPYTFTATAEVIRYLGADPLFVDIDPATFNLAPHKLEAKIESLRVKGKLPKALIPVHFAGQACEMDPILDICRKNNIRVVEDAAHALPCTHNGEMVGSIGDATVFSFYVTKTLATGEGGMITTRSEEVARRIRTMRLHGINRDVWDRYRSSKPNWFYEVVAPGFKYNMPDIMAAIGIHQLAKVKRFQQRREAIAARYTEAFRDLPLKIPEHKNPKDTHSWHLYVVQFDLERIPMDRDRFIEMMAERGIGTSVHFIPLHLHPYWRDRYGLNPEDFPVSLDCYRRAVSLPIYSKMTDPEVMRVIEALRGILA